MPQILSFARLEEKGLDIIVPVYNPAKMWERKFVADVRHLSDYFPDVELRYILVNDGTTLHFDARSVQYLKDRIAQLSIHQLPKNKGKGYAIRYGAQFATAPIVSFTDVDFPYRFEDFRKMYDSLADAKIDLVVGHRSGVYYKNIPYSRRFLSKSLRKVLRILFKLSVEDTQSGLKMFGQMGKKALLDTTINRYLFDLELIRIADNRGLQVLSIPLELRGGIQMGGMPLKVLLGEFGNLLRLFLKKP